MASISPERPPTPKSASEHAEYKESGEVSDREQSQSTSASPATHNSRTSQDAPQDPPIPTADAPPLPDEAPPLPDEAPPLLSEAPTARPVDDGWDAAWDDNAQAFYFYNRFTNVTQWENPRISETSQPPPPGVTTYAPSLAPIELPLPTKPVSGYDPAIHGDYDPEADYAKVHQSETQDETAAGAPATDPSQLYAATGTFNRFTGKWQAADINPERYNDESKSKRQMNAFFDVDAAANAHEGKSLKAERANKKLSKQEVKAFKEKRREKKEEKRRAWLRD